MNELLLKFKTEKERLDFIEWFETFGQFDYKHETENSIDKTKIDDENFVIVIQ